VFQRREKAEEEWQGLLHNATFGGEAYPVTKKGKTSEKEHTSEVEEDTSKRTKESVPTIVGGGRGGQWRRMLDNRQGKHLVARQSSKEKGMSTEPWDVFCERKKGKILKGGEASLTSPPKEGERNLERQLWGEKVHPRPIRKARA